MSRPGVSFSASVVMAALLAPVAGAHDGIMTPAGHAAEDAVVLTAKQERTLDAHTRAVSAKYARAAAAMIAGGAQDVGEWGPVVDWPGIDPDQKGGIRPHWPHTRQGRRGKTGHELKIAPQVGGE